MKIEIETKYNTIPDELLQPIPSVPNLEERKHNGHTYVHFGAVKVGEAFSMLGRKKTLTRYCKSCGCEPCATWPDPGIWFYTEYNYDRAPFANDYTWKTRVDSALRPYFERNKIQEAFNKKVEAEEAEIRKMPCPICGGELSFGKNENAEIYESYKRVERFVVVCDVPIQVSANAEAVEPIKASEERLREYLLNIINIEKNIRALRQRLLVLYSLSYEVNRNAKFAQLYPIMSEKRAIAEALDRMQSEFRARANEISELQRRRDRLSAAKIVFPPCCFSNPTD